MKLTIIFKEEIEEHMKKAIRAFHESAAGIRCEVRTHGRGVSILHYFGHGSLAYG